MEYDASQPWLRQPFDTDQGWALFTEYLLAGPTRTLKVCLRGRCPWDWGRLSQVAFEDAWKERAQAWDAHIHAQRLATVEQVTKEDARARAERQGKLARKLQRVGELEINRLTKVLERDDGGQIGTLRPHEAIRAVALGIHAERLALGDSTERIETGPNLDDLSVEDLRKIKELEAKVKQP